MNWTQELLPILLLLAVVLLVLRRLPRVLGEAELRRMGFDVARGLAERGVVRLLRDVLLPPEGVGFPPLASA